ncbi:MAG: polyprenyl synthetase family protein [Verrucomicrobiae bacterium]|nr:polyprenyl synthetase family protein [Verrucomicrobiae bacterium]
MTGGIRGEATAVARKGPELKLADLLRPIARELERVERELVEQIGGFDSRVHGYVDYVVRNSGKRLRPTLALLSGGATGRIYDGHVTLGVIVELIHIATLVHDDVLDEAELRHGSPTANTRWGNEISVLLGDCLFAHALRLAASYPTTEVCRRISEATNTVCAGEILQTERRFDLNLTVDQYLDIINMKTAALFAVSCELGASLNGSPPTVVEQLREFGTNLGIAYQIYDDCVDIWGQECQAGKSLGTDMKKGKLTLPYLLLLRGCHGEQRRQLGQAIFSQHPDQRAQLLESVSRNGVAAETRQVVDTYLGRADEALRALSPNLFTATLGALLRYLTIQTRHLIPAS